MRDHDGCWLYILRCADGSYYVGTTRSTPEQRLSQHQLGIHGGYTATRRPVALVHAEHYARLTDSIAAERRIKGWSRVKKEAWIEGRYDDLPALARRRASCVSRRAGVPPSSFETLASQAPQDEGSVAAGLEAGSPAS